MQNACVYFAELETSSHSTLKKFAKATANTTHLLTHSMHPTQQKTVFSKKNEI